MTVYTRHGHYCVVPALGNKYANRHSVKACGASLASYKMLMSPKMCLSTLWFCFVFHFPENHSLQPKCQVLILNRALVSSLKLQEKKKYSSSFLSPSWKPKKHVWAISAHDEEIGPPTSQGLETTKLRNAIQLEFFCVQGKLPSCSSNPIHKCWPPHSLLVTSCPDIDIR